MDTTPSLRGNYKVIDEASSGVCYYFMRLPRQHKCWLAMTGFL
ncbi:hypothetical protein RMAECT_0507 [Rickettsia rhipicephali str. Ect]|uniref:Uncharacterized protein n=1 Tax=Rickettsia rhipicephali str. Ect TaxID=1359199 RepID=A0A0F3PDY8_RICRH|nr:hypothetical protein RMAECT_0507 [Rickettsia rhipicephali str. Ect]